MADSENMVASLHGKCGKLHCVVELPDTFDDCDPPRVIRHHDKLYHYEDEIAKLAEIGLDINNIDVFYYVAFEPFPLV